MRFLLILGLLLGSVASPEMALAEPASRHNLGNVELALKQLQAENARMRKELNTLSVRVDRVEDRLDRVAVKTSTSNSKRSTFSHLTLVEPTKGEETVVVIPSEVDPDSVVPPPAPPAEPESAEARNLKSLITGEPATVSGSSNCASPKAVTYAPPVVASASCSAPQSVAYTNPPVMSVSQASAGGHASFTDNNGVYWSKRDPNSNVYWTTSSTPAYRSSNVRTYRKPSFFGSIFKSSSRRSRPATTYGRRTSQSTRYTCDSNGCRLVE